ncbi:MAG TPA: histidine kinase [Streptosporangiaceae bacterium]|nr:histidine kinase [Streptosporangiaceae bacterium]
MGLAVSRSSHLARAVAVAMWLAGFGFGLLSLRFARSHPGATFGGTSWPAGLTELAAGWAVIGAGCYVWRRRGKRSGLFLAAAGVAWFFPEWDNPGVGAAAFAFGLVTYALAPAVVAHAVLAYPSGRLSSPLGRLAVTVAYADAALVLGLLPALFFSPPGQGCSLCPPNLLLADDRPGLYESLNRWGIGLGLVWTITAAALCVWRLARPGASLRRAAAPVLAGGAAYLLLAGSDFAHSLPRGVLGTDQFEYRLWLAQAAALCVIGLGVAWSWLLARRARSAMAALVVELGQSPAAGGLREVLARSLGDPDLEVAYPLGNPERLVDATGAAVDPATRQGHAVTPLTRRGETVALLSHRPGLLDDPAIVDEVIAATRLAVDNERLQAEVLAQLQELRASRARIVTTGDAERRRLERDLHDGAQQRLVGLSLALRLARVQPGAAADPDLRAVLDQADERLRAAIGELRELAHGIYPAALADDGLAAAVEALAEHTPIPLTIMHMPQQRLPGPVEAAAYFLIAETTGHIATLAAAGGVTLDVRRDGNRLVVDVTENAAGQPGRELDARLSGLADRVGALDGQLRVEHAAGGGVTIRAEMPCGS